MKEKKTPKSAVPAAPVERVVRETANGVTRPKDGTATGTVWSVADKLSATKGNPATRAEVMAECEKKAINPATVTTQYGKWRKFHGLTGRLPKEAAPDPKATKTKAPKAGKAKNTAPAPV